LSQPTSKHSLNELCHQNEKLHKSPSQHNEHCITTIIIISKQYLSKNTSRSCDTMWLWSTTAILTMFWLFYVHLHKAQIKFAATNSFSLVISLWMLCCACKLDKLMAATMNLIQFAQSVKFDLRLRSRQIAK